MFDLEDVIEDLMVGGAAEAGTITSGEYINWVKRSLNRRYGLRLPINGVASASYRDAVRRFQRDVGRPETGHIDAAAQNILIKWNETTRAYMKWAHEALGTDAVGIYTDPARAKPKANGSYKSNGLRLGIRMFQRREGLSVDGYIGAKTETVLIKRSGLKPPGHVGGKPKPKPPPPRSPVIREIDLWMNVFIPDTLPGKYLRRAEFGPYKGRVFLKPPSIGPFAPGSTSFKTDERSWRKSKSVGERFSRLHTAIWLGARPKAETSVTTRRVGKTIAIDRMDNVICSKTAKVAQSLDVSKMKRIGSRSFAWDLTGFGRNPCNLPGMFNKLTPKIDYELRVKVAFERDRRAAKVEVAGMIDEFPAYEMYAKCNDGPTYTLFRKGPTGSPWKLTSQRSVKSSKRVFPTS